MTTKELKQWMQSRGLEKETFTELKDLSVDSIKAAFKKLEGEKE